MNNTVKIILGIIVVALVVWLIVSKKDSSVTDSQESIKIGGAFALTGDVAEYGEADMQGAQLAVDEINAKGGVNGKTLKLLVEDTRSTSKDTVSAFTKLRSVNGAKYFIVSFADTYPGTESLVGPDELMISPDAGVEVMNGEVMHDNVFGTWYRTQPKSELVIKHLAETGKKKLYMAVGNDGYYETVIEYTKQAAEKYGIEIVGIDQFGSGTDMKSILPKVKASGADALFFGILDDQVYTDFLKDKLGFLKDVAIYTDEVATSYLGAEYASYMEDMYFYTNVPPKQEFLEAFKKKFNHEPQITASVSYDTVYIMAEVMKDNPENISDYMRSRSFDTVSYGKITFDELGGVMAEEDYFTIKQVKNGEAVEVTK